MPTPENLDYFEERTLHAVQEGYSQYKRPMGAKSVSSYMQYRDKSRVKEVLSALEEKDLLDSPAPGLWKPVEASEEDDSLIKKKTVSNQLKILKEKVSSNSKGSVKECVDDWCENMELELSL